MRHLTLPALILTTFAIPSYGQDAVGLPADATCQTVIDAELKRGTYAVLDRAPATTPKLATLRGSVDTFRLRYLDASNRWSDTWPPLRDAVAGSPDLLTQFPRAVEFRIGTRDYGEVAGVVELVASWPSQAPP